MNPVGLSRLSHELDQDEAVEEFMSRLINWATWARTGITRHTCGSAEARYVAPRDEDKSIRQSSRPVDVLDAEIVESAVCAMQNTVSKRILKAIYVERRNDRMLLKAFNVRMSQIELLRQQAVREAMLSCRRFDAHTQAREKSAYSARGLNYRQPPRQEPIGRASVSDANL